MKKLFVGEGKVHLLSGGSKIFTDVAARVVASEKSGEEILATPYDAKIVDNILSAGHLAATEFDYFIFFVEGYSRACEAQLIRKRLASYLIKSGRVQKKGTRSYDVVLPKSLEKLKNTVYTPIEMDSLFYMTANGKMVPLFDVQDMSKTAFVPFIKNNADLQLNLNEHWYNTLAIDGEKEEELRYMKPQATEFKGIVGMNAHALIDWFKIRTCMNAQTEIRDMATKMLKLCKDVAPDLFKDAGPSCKNLGYCPENKYMNKKCKAAGKYLQKSEALKVLKCTKILNGD